MAKKTFLVDIDLLQNELQNAALQNLAAPPGSPVQGQVYYDTTLSKIGFYNGTSWIYGGIAMITGTAPIVAVTDVNGNATISITAATTLSAGSMSASDKTKLDNATNNNTPSTIVFRDANGDFSSRIGTFAGTGTNSGVTLSGTVTNPTDATTKAYVDSVAQGLKIKSPVTALSDSNIPSLSGLPTVDGVTLTAGQRVLLTAQTSGVDNGIWVVAAGAWSRPSDFANGSSASSSFVFVQQGTNYADTGWVCTTDPPSDIVGTDSLTWVQFSSAGIILAGTGLTKTGNTINANAADDSIQMNADNFAVKRDGAGAVGLTASGVKVNVDNTTIEIASNQLQVKASTVAKKFIQTGVSIGTTPGTQVITHNLNNQWVQVAVYDSSTGVEYSVATVATGVNACTVTANGATRTVTVIVIG